MSNQNNTEMQLIREQNISHIGLNHQEKYRKDQADIGMYKLEILIL